VTITSQELAAGSLLVAVVAIAANVVTSRSANKSQRLLAREQYQRDHLTDTYLDLLKALSARVELLDEPAPQEPGDWGQAPGESGLPDASADASFRVRMTAYASKKVFWLWGDFEEASDKLGAVLGEYRRQHQGHPPDLTPGTKLDPQVQAAGTRVETTMTGLIRQVRTELGSEDVPDRLKSIHPAFELQSPPETP
jgi:hypothetical protein